KLLPQGFDETWDLRRTSSQINLFDMLARRAGAEEVERLLDFEHDDFSHLLQDGLLGVFADGADLPAQLERLGIVEAQIQLLLQRVGVLMTAYADVAREQRRGALDDVDV